MIIASLLQVTLANWYGAEGRETFTQFMEDVIDRTSDPPWNEDHAKKNNMTVIAYIIIIIRAQCDKTYLLTSAPNEHSTQPVHPRSLNRVFVVRMKVVCILGNPKCDQWRFWSDCSNAQTDQNLRRARISEGKFSEIAVAYLCFVKIENSCTDKGTGYIRRCSAIVYKKRTHPRTTLKQSMFQRCLTAGVITIAFSLPTHSTSSCWKGIYSKM